MASTSKPKPPKSILKKRADDATTPHTSIVSSSSAPPPSSLRDHLAPSLPSDLLSNLPEHLRTANPAHLATALHHASLIERRKALEHTILLSLEALVDFPASSSPAARPSPADIQAFKSLLRPFQPSDFDSLIEERGINDRCGYALCPNPAPSKGDARGGYRLFGAGGKAKDFKIVKAAEAGRWCSGDCARRAMYVKVQLSETPAWERDAGYGGDIELLGERQALSARERRDEQLAQDLKKLDIICDPEGRGVEDRKDLALERGEMTPAAVMRGGLVEVHVKEKEVSKLAVAPSLDDEEVIDGMRGLHLVEGYASRFGGKA